MRIEEDKGNIIGEVNKYIKGNRKGEYVLDNGWEEELESEGGRYYKKFKEEVKFKKEKG